MFKFPGILPIYTDRTSIGDQPCKGRERSDWSDKSLPMMAGGNICPDVDGRHQGIAYGGIGSIHLMAKRTGLVDEINQQLERL